MLWIHPILQLTNVFLAAWVLYMGFRRFQFQHLKKKVVFNWKQHVLWGQVVHAVWLAGFGLGLFMAYQFWGSFDLTGSHFTVAMIMAPLLVIGFVTGLMLKKPKGLRKNLALLHGGTNTLLFVLTLYQVWSGAEAIQLFLLD